jgi:hypothetical protein
MRKVGGYLILAGLFGGWFGAASFSLGIVQTSIMTGVVVTVFGLLALAAYLIQE